MMSAAPRVMARGFLTKTTCVAFAVSIIECNSYNLCAIIAVYPSVHPIKHS